MKRINQYITPQSTLLEVRFEGPLCTSQEEDNQVNGDMEGYGNKNDFPGWGF